MLCIRDAKIMGHKRRAVGVLILHFLPTNVLLFVLGPVQLYRNKPGFVQIIKIYIKQRSNLDRNQSGSPIPKNRTGPQGFCWSCFKWQVLIKSEDKVAGACGMVYWYRSCRSPQPPRASYRRSLPSTPIPSPSGTSTSIQRTKCFGLRCLALKTRCPYAIIYAQKPVVIAQAT